jgi:hypothetical protein
VFPEASYSCSLGDRVGDFNLVDSSCGKHVGKISDVKTAST